MENGKSDSINLTYVTCYFNHWKYSFAKIPKLIKLTILLKNELSKEEKFKKRTAFTEMNFTLKAQ